jgi:hypothetical protein
MRNTVDLTGQSWRSIPSHVVRSEPRSTRPELPFIDPIAAIPAPLPTDRSMHRLEIIVAVFALVAALLIGIAR